jgi:hypothetical protein
MGIIVGKFSASYFILNELTLNILNIAPSKKYGHI